MKRSMTWFTLAAAMLAASVARPITAQTLDDRVVISVNGGFQPTKNDFSQTLPFTINVESATSKTDYKVPGGPLVDAGFIVRLTSRFGAGIAGGGSTIKSDGTVAARIPHPFFFDRHREITGASGDLDRRETAVHAMGALLWPLNDRLLFIISGGPSLFMVEQQLATTVHYAEEYPFDTATFTSVDLRKAKEQRIGFNAGVDVTYRFARHFGAGAVVRFSRAQVEFDKGQDSAVTIDAGGVQAGAGLRILF